MEWPLQPPAMERPPVESPFEPETRPLSEDPLVQGFIGAPARAGIQAYRNLRRPAEFIMRHAAEAGAQATPSRGMLEAGQAVRNLGVPLVSPAVGAGLELAASPGTAAAGAAGVGADVVLDPLNLVPIPLGAVAGGAVRATADLAPRAGAAIAEKLAPMAGRAPGLARFLDPAAAGAAVGRGAEKLGMAIERGMPTLAPGFQGYAARRGVPEVREALRRSTTERLAPLPGEPVMAPHAERDAYRANLYDARERLAARMRTEAEAAQMRADREAEELARGRAQFEKDLADAQAIQDAEAAAAQRAEHDRLLASASPERTRPSPMSPVENDEAMNLRKMYTHDLEEKKAEAATLAQEIESGIRQAQDDVAALYQDSKLKRLIDIVAPSRKIDKKAVEAEAQATALRRMGGDEAILGDPGLAPLFDRQVAQAQREIMSRIRSGPRGGIRAGKGTPWHGEIRDLITQSNDPRVRNLIGRLFRMKGGDQSLDVVTREVMEGVESGIKPEIPMLQAVIDEIVAGAHPRPTRRDLIDYASQSVEGFNANWERLQVIRTRIRELERGASTIARVAQRAPGLESRTAGRAPAIAPAMPPGARYPAGGGRAVAAAEPAMLPPDPYLEEMARRAEFVPNAGVQRGVQSEIPGAPGIRPPAAAAGPAPAGPQGRLPGTDLEVTPPGPGGPLPPGSMGQRGIWRPPPAVMEEAQRAALNPKSWREVHPFLGGTMGFGEGYRDPADVFRRMGQPWIYRVWDDAFERRTGDWDAFRDLTAQAALLGGEERAGLRMVPRIRRGSPMSVAIGRVLDDYPKRARAYFTAVAGMKGERLAKAMEPILAQDALDRELLAANGGAGFQAAEAFRTLFDIAADEFGLSRQRYLMDYFPHLINHTDDGLLGSELVALMHLKPGEEIPRDITNRFLLERIGNSLDYTHDVIDAVTAYAGSGLRRKYLSQPYRMVTGILQQKGPKGEALIPENAAYYTRKYMERQLGRPEEADILAGQTAKNLAGFIGKVARGIPLARRTGWMKDTAKWADEFQRLPTFLAGRRMSSHIRRDAMIGLLGFNPGSALENMMQNVNTFAEVGPMAWMNGVRWTRRAWMGTNGAERRRLQEMLKRNGVFESADPMRMLDPMDQMALDRMGDAAMWMFRSVEVMNRSNAFFSGYREGIRRGLGEDAAQAMGRDIMNRTQFSYRGPDVPLAFQTATGKIVHQLGQYPIRNLNWMQPGRAIGQTVRHPLKTAWQATWSLPRNLKSVKPGSDEESAVRLWRYMAATVVLVTAGEATDYNAAGTLLPTVPIMDPDSPIGVSLRGGFLRLGAGPAVRVGMDALAGLQGRTKWRDFWPTAVAFLPRVPTGVPMLAGLPVGGLIRLEARRRRAMEEPDAWSQALVLTGKKINR